MSKIIIFWILVTFDFQFSLQKMANRDILDLLPGDTQMLDFMDDMSDPSSETDEFDKMEDGVVCPRQVVFMPSRTKNVQLKRQGIVTKI